MARVFLSHATVDRIPTETVHGWLTAAGHDAFLDHHPEDGIAPGEAWEVRLHERLRWADAVVSMITSAYLRSTWCTAEVAIARNRGALIIPVLFEPGVSHPLLSSLQHVDGTTRLDTARDRLVEQLTRIDNSGGTLPDGVSPYPGLRPFDRDLNRVFFGREAEIKALCADLRSSANRAEGVVHLLVGPSGCGKSSLLRAGLRPAVAREPDTFSLAPCTPGRNPRAAVVEELAVAAKDLRLPARLRRRIDEVGFEALLDEAGVTHLLDELLRAVPGHRRSRLLLPVDQFEELLTQTSPAGRTEFVEFVHAIMPRPLQIVATLRPEFLEPLLSTPELQPLRTRVHTLQPLRPAALAAVIQRPAAFAGFTIDAGLVEEMVADTGSGDALPLLAYTLQQLAVDVTRGGRISRERYLQLGRVPGALAEQAEDALREAIRAGGRTREAVLRELLRLVVVDDELRPSRWRVIWTDLHPTAVTELRQFVDRRLLVTDSEGERTVVGVAHEAFLTEWEPLRSAIEARATALRAKRRIEHATQEWSESRPPELLWDGAQLAGAVADTHARLIGRRRTLVSDQIGLSPPAEDFLRSSMVRDRRRRRRTVAVLSTLLLLVSIGAGMAVWQWRVATQQQQLAVARQLLAQSDLVRPTDVRAALRLGLAAENISPSAGAGANLLATLTGTRYTRTLPSPTIVVSLAYAPNGAVLATGGDDGQVGLWDMTNPTAPRRLGKPLTTRPGYVYDMTFSPDSRTLAAVGADRTITLFDVTRPAEARPLESPLLGHQGLVHGVAFAQDGTLASVDFAGRLNLTDLRDPARPRPLADLATGHTDKVTDVAFSADGTLLATTGYDRTIRLWDVTDRARPATVGAPLTGPQGAIWAVAFAPSGRLLAAVGADGTLALWDATDPLAVRSLSVRSTVHTGSAYAVSFSRDGSRLATAGGDGIVGLWSLADPSRPTRIGDRLVGHTGQVFSVMFAPSDDRTLVSAGADHTAVLWDLAGTRPAPIGPPLPGAQAVNALAINPAGLLARGSKDGGTELWDMTDPRWPRPRGDPLPGPAEVRSLAFSPDGALLATTAMDGSLTLWDVAGSAPARRVSSVPATVGGAFSLAFTQDRQVAVAGDDGSVGLWDVSDPGRPARIGTDNTAHTGPVFAVAASPDGRWLASVGAEGAVLLWDVAGNDGPRRLRPGLINGGAARYAVAFAPDGRLLAAAGAEGAAQLWAVTADGARPTGPPMSGGGGRIFALAFAGDSGILATGWTDGSVGLWDVTNPAEPRLLGGTTSASVGAVHALTFAAAGWLAIGGSTGQTALWDLSRVGELRANPVQRACAMVGRGFDPGEWADAVPTVSYRDTCPPMS